MKKIFIFSVITFLSIFLQNCTNRDFTDSNVIENNKINYEEVDNRRLGNGSNTPMSMYVYYVLIDYLEGVSSFEKFNAKTTFEHNASYPIYKVYNGVVSNQEVWLISSEDLWVINTLVVPLPQVTDFNDTSVFKVFYTEEGLADREAAREFLIDFVAFEEHEDYDICIHPNCCTTENTEDDPGTDDVIEYVELISNEDFKD